MTRIRMTAWHFVVRDSGGEVKTVTFYARSTPEALRLVQAWAKRTGHVLDPDDKEKAA
jgi:hypothetical protein